METNAGTFYKSHSIDSIIIIILICTSLVIKLGALKGWKRLREVFKFKL